MKKKAIFRTASIKESKEKDIIEKDINPALIPYVSHYNHDTILTKNGELIKIIKITGANRQSIQQGHANIRKIIRESIKDNIKSDDFAFWIHTIRKKKNILLNDDFKDFLPKTINQKWTQKNKWDEVYINELYISIIIQINSEDKGFITEVRKNLLSIFPPIFKLNIENNLKKSYDKLTKAVDNIQKDLEVFGSKILSIYKEEDVFFSEPISFFGKILNLADEKYPLLHNDISEQIIENSKLTFDKNVIKINKDGKKHFASIFSVKEYHETSVDLLDKFLQLPQEFIITQSIDFIDKQYTIEEFEYQNYILEVSNSKVLKKLSGLKDIVAENKGLKTDYAEQQITITILSDSKKELANKFQESVASLHQLGIIINPEEIFLEHCFWAKLPANFSFTCRKKITNISKLGGFASLHNLPFGKKNDNKWGEAICILKTVYNTPYYLNLHKNKNDNGNVVIIGPDGSGKTMLLNFIISQTRKIKNRLFYFDCHHCSSAFIAAIKGRSFISGQEKGLNNLKLNPLLLKNNKENSNFICKWFLYLVSYGKNKIDHDELSLITSIVPKIIKKNITKLGEAAKLFNNEKTKNIYKKLAIWYGKGKYAFIFDNPEEINLQESIINAFDITELLEKKPLLLPVFSYLLHKIEQSLDGEPSIIVMDEAWRIAGNKVISKKLLNFQKKVNEKNAIIIFSCEASDSLNNENIIKLISNSSTLFLMPNSNPNIYYEDIFGLDEEEIKILASIKQQERLFLLKQDSTTVTMRLCLDHLGRKIVKILSGNKKFHEKAQKYIQKYGEEPEQWVSELIDINLE